MSRSEFRRNIFEKPEQRDESLVGITFVDVLFALVVGRVLQPVAAGLEIPNAGKAQLLVAFTLTVTSWIGYHNSWNRPRYFIRFINLPLAQFLIDVALVIVYWLTATWVEGFPLEDERSSALPEAALLTISFALYILWDHVGFRIRLSDRYFGTPLGRDVLARRRVSQVFFLTTLLTTVLIYLCSPSETGQVIAIDTWLVIVLVGYRVAKEAVTSPESRKTTMPKSSSGEEDLSLDKD